MGYGKGVGSHGFRRGSAISLQPSSNYHQLAKVGGLEPGFLSRLRQRSCRVQIQLMNRAVIDGTLADVSRYEVLLQDQQGCHVLTKREIASITCSQLEHVVEGEGERVEATASDLQPPTSLPDRQTSNVQPHASHGRPDIQETFLAQVQAQRQMIDLYLLTGARYRGRLLGYDHFTLYLRDDHKSEDHLFYKHGVSTIHLARP